jgi:O-antigen/teichoic acid export membrane protein
MSIKVPSILNKLIYSSLFKASGIYTLTGFINASIPFLLLPVLTRELSPSDYGIVSMFQVSIGILVPLVGLNLEGSIARKFYDKQNTSSFPEYIGSCLLISFISFLVLLGVGLLFSDSISGITKIPSFWVRIMFLITLPRFFTLIILTIYQINVKPLNYGLIQILQSVLNVGLTILLVVYIDKSWEGRIEAQIITFIVIGLLSIFLLIKKKLIKFNVKKSDIIYAISFGLPLIPHAIGGVFFSGIDRFFLTNIEGLEQTGNFTAAYQIGAVISLITISFNNAYVPWLYDKLNRNDQQIKIKIVKFTYLYFCLITLLALVLIFIFPFIVSVVIGKSFTTTNIYSTFIVLGFVFQGMYFMVTNYILYVKKTHIQAAVTMSIALVKIPVSFLLITYLGAVGASVSFFITFLLFFMVTWLVSSRVYKMPWNHWSLNFITPKR